MAIWGAKQESRIEKELETTNSEKCKNESETDDLVEWFDSDKPNYIKAKRTKRQPKPTPTRRSRRVEGRQSRNGKGVADKATIEVEVHRT